MNLPVKSSLAIAALLLAAGCGTLSAKERAGRSGDVAVDPHGPAADFPMILGDPFVIDGVTWRPEDKFNYDMVGYGEVGSEGGTGVSVANKTLPLPSYVEVTSLNTGKTILARVERRGPMRNDRLIEFSPAAAAQLGVASGANEPVRVRRVNPSEPERAALRGGQPVSMRMETPKSLVAVLMRKLEAQQPNLAAPAPAPTPSATPAPPARPTKRKPVRTKPEPPQPTPSASPSPASEPQAQPPRGTLVVQAAAFSSRERAEAAAKRLGGSVSPAGNLFRVRVGPFATTAQAQAALAKVRNAGYSDARIQRAN